MHNVGKMDQHVWREQCDQICHFGKSLQIFGKFLTVYFLLGKLLSPLRQICDFFGLFSLL